MSNGKYSNLLTGLLILAIIAVVGLLVFLGIDLYNKFYLDKEVSKGVEQFDSMVPDIDSNEAVDYSYNEIIIDQPQNNSSTDNIVNPFDNIDRPEATPSATSSSNKKGIPYKSNGKEYLQVGTISIPRTGLSCVILDNAGKSELEIAVGLLYGPGLNEVGNTIIAGHNYRNGTLFSKNKNIQVGDKINIKDVKGRTITYIVYNKFETTMEDTSYFNKDTNGKREITLYSCNDDSSRRIVIEAREQ